MSRSIAVFMFPSGIFPHPPGTRKRSTFVLALSTLNLLNLHTAPNTGIIWIKKQKDRNKNKAKNKDTLNQHCNDKTPTKTKKKQLERLGEDLGGERVWAVGRVLQGKEKEINQKKKKNQKESNNQNTKNQTKKTQNNQRDKTRKGELRRDNRGEAIL